VSREIRNSVSLQAYEKALPEIPPVLPFSKGGEFFGRQGRIPFTLSPIEKGEKGDLTLGNGCLFLQ
jgi:hypothetical protein